MNINKKSICIIISFLFACTIFLMLPSQLYGDTVTYTDGDFEMKITPGYYDESNIISLKYNGNSQYSSETGAHLNIAYYDPAYNQVGSLDRYYNIVSWPYEFSMTGIIPNEPNLQYLAQVYHVISGGQVINDWIYYLDFTLTEKPKTSESSSSKEQEAEIWVRNHEMQCWQVWINDDNAFEFVFVWEYANNNHVQIIDMAGNLVFETDMQKGNAHFVAPLPDGMYTVKTFHEAGHILQEFVIGKP